MILIVVSSRNTLKRTRFSLINRSTNENRRCRFTYIDEIDSSILRVFSSFLPLIWGVTNSFLKRGSTGLKTIHSDNRLKQFFAELYYFFTNAQFWIPFVLNQCGSILYYYTLSKTDLSTAVPVTNALTLVFTYFCDVFSRPSLLNSKFLLGMFCVTSGVALCVISKPN